jgi:hypothetical protein
MTDLPICYFSNKLDKHQKNYSTFEKEYLVLLLSLKHFYVYVGFTFCCKNTISLLNILKAKIRRELMLCIELDKFVINLHSDLLLQYI